MKRIGILTAGGDTPALNATIQGAVARANQLRVEVFGFIKGFSGLLNPRCRTSTSTRSSLEIPELDPTRGGTILGASRDYVDPATPTTLDAVADRLAQSSSIDGLICVGGDGTLNGMQALAERLPTVLAPKTIDNDLGLNYRNEPDEWSRDREPQRARVPLQAHPRSRHLRPRGDGQLRDARLRHRRLRLGAGRPAHPHHRREPPPHRDHRGHGPPLRLHRPGHRLRPARHHPRPRVPAERRAAWSSASASSTSCRRTS